MVWKRVGGRASLPLRILWCGSVHIVCKNKRGGRGWCPFTDYHKRRTGGTSVRRSRRQMYTAACGGPIH